MAIITQYPLVDPAKEDYLVGSQISTTGIQTNPTKNFTVNNILSLLSFAGTKELDSKNEGNQILGASGTTLQILFGAASGGATDDVQIAADGTITFNTTCIYLVEFSGSFERQGSSGGVSAIDFRYNFAGVDNVPQSVHLSDADVNFPFEKSFIVNAQAGDTLYFEMVRDAAESSGNGSTQGGMYAHTPSSAGWNDIVPSSHIEIYKLSNTL